MVLTFLLPDPMTARAPVTITIRVTEAIANWLEASAAEGESRAQRVRRALGDEMARERLNRTGAFISSNQ